MIEAVLPLRDIVVFPKMIVPLFVGREKSVNALEMTMSENKDIVLVTQRVSKVEEPGSKDLYNIGTLCKILQLLKLPDGTLKVLVEGKKRVKINFLPESKNYNFLTCNFKVIPNLGVSKVEITKINVLHTVFEDYLNLNKKTNNEIINLITEIKDPSKLCDTIISNLTLTIEEKQEFLEEINVASRIEKLISKLELEIDTLEIDKKVRNRVKSQMEKTQREYYLNEQLKAIQKELGNDDDGVDEFQEIKEKISKVKLSKDALDKVNSEFKKLKNMSPMSAESGVVRSYIDWILSLPWRKVSKINYDLTLAKKILEKDHYGLKNVKERILEFLVVQKRSKSLKGPILCLVGPPGVGKTSLGKSIAKATGRTYLRMALGGVRDEAEVRGHRRTYIGSLPGKIIQGLKKSKFNNPLFLLDEIDKIGSDYRGDPSSALLEVLDPEQNNNFQDHYLEIDYDLSKTMFITTANTLNIPDALLDRMEIIRLPGYTESEKLQIAKNHLISKLMKENNVEDGEITISDEILQEIIQKYTKEAGVRSLERELSKLIRKIITDIEINGTTSEKIDQKSVLKFLGPPKYNRVGKENIDLVGITNGLAWTQVGGEILSIEVVKVPGKGRFSSTGKLGDVMKESIKAAEFYIKSNYLNLGIEQKTINAFDVHVHVPEGATPKDGPSAGVAMISSIVSALTENKVRCDIAMTGEITLKGKVLPIGGLKEKLLAATQNGIKKVLIPHDNKKDLIEIDKEILSKLKINTVKHVDEILSEALQDKIIPLIDIKPEISQKIQNDQIEQSTQTH
ncbi:endopeptidase La [Alphaproteobacteria bacterium]|nr:endopeptidase La [Alphaproteobacteria bacterium]